MCSLPTRISRGEACTSGASMHSLLELLFGLEIRDLLSVGGNIRKS